VANGIISFAKLNDTGGGGDLSLSGVTSPNAVWGIAIDPANGKIYFADGGNRISFVNLDGTGHGGDLNTHGAEVDDPLGVAIDPANGKIYWTNFSDALHPISFANLNDTGGGGNLNVGGAQGFAVGLAIDPTGRKVYWTEHSGAIFFTKLNDTGGGGQINTSGASSPMEPGQPALLKKPLATAKPVLSGGSRVGSKLSCSQGKWAPDLIGSFLYQRPVRFSYKFSRNGKPIGGASTQNSYTTRHPGTYTCTVTAINHAGGTNKTSTTHTVKP
jgi:hypothetical protein